MIEIFKKEYKNTLLTLGYIIIACIVYGIWFDSIFHLWYITLIVVLLVFVIGATIGYFYIKNEYNKNQNNIENNQ